MANQLKRMSVSLYIHIVAIVASSLFISGCVPALHNAAATGDTAKISSLLNSGEYDLNMLGGTPGITPLMYAVANDQPDAVRLLLERGSDINKRDKDNNNALVWAAQNTGLTRLLIEKGADVDSAIDSLKRNPGKCYRCTNTSEAIQLIKKLSGRGDPARAFSEVAKPSPYEQATQQNSPAFNTVLPYQTLATVPPGLPLPIDGLWTINQGRLRISDSRMFFVNDVRGIAHVNMVNIKEIKQAGAKTYALSGFVAYQGKGYYVPGEFQVISDRALLLTLYPKPELGLPNGYSEVYTREKLDDDALFAAQLTAPATVHAKKPDDIALPGFKAASDENAIAIVIGIEKYQILPSAGFVRSDATLMRDYLKAMGYQDRNIEFLTDERATFSSIRKAVETWLPNRISPQSRVTIYYAGHGAPDPQSGEAYIVPYDGDPNYLPDTGYPLKRLYERLEKLPAKQVVVMIDACFSGAGGRGVLAAGVRSLVRIEKTAPKGNRIAVLTSTQGTQISTSSPDKKHGLFTYYLLKALQENNQDLSAVYDYLKPRVEDEAKRMNVEQTPSISPKSSAIKGLFRLW